MTLTPPEDFHVVGRTPVLGVVGRDRFYESASLDDMKRSDYHHLFALSPRACDYFDDDATLRWIWYADDYHNKIITLEGHPSLDPFRSGRGQISQMSDELISGGIPPDIGLRVGQQYLGTEFEGKVIGRLEDFAGKRLISARKVYVPELPTEHQIQYISMLCMRLGIRDHLEEGVSTRDEASRLIVELEARERGLHPQPATVTLTPMSPVEERVLEISYGNKPFIGTLISRASEDSLEVHELAVDSPRVVTKEFMVALGDALDTLAVEKGLSKVKIVYLPQHLRMYELAGFTQSYEEGESSMVVRRVK